MSSHFHLAFPAHDLPATRQFYVEGLGCEVGRETEYAIILKLGEAQIVAQKTTEPAAEPKGIYPRHFGVIYKNRRDWEQVLEKAISQDLEFYQHPRIRHPGTPTEHDTFFLKDPSNNLIEFKHYHRESAIFGERAEKRAGDY